MPSTQWLGRAGAVADVSTITVGGSWAGTETVTITINGKDLVVTIGSLISTAQVATTIQEAFEGDTITDSTGSVIPSTGKSGFAEHSQLTATVSASVVTLTANTAGEPWVVSDHLAPALSTGTAQGGTASTIQLAAAETYSDDEINGHIVEILGGVGAGQWRFITNYTGASDTADISPDWDTNPDATSEYSIRKCAVQVSTDSAAGTVVLAPSTRATGPNHVDNADNWDAGEIPGATGSTTAYIGNSSVSLLYGYMDFSETLTSFNVEKSFSADIGLPRTNATGYPEFRPHYQRVESSAIRLKGGDGPGSGRVKIDSVDIATAITVEDTGSGLETGLGAFIWKGTHASNTLHVTAGSVSVAPFDGETATLTTIHIATGTVVAGDAVTNTTVTNTGGEYTTSNTITTLKTGPGSTTTILGSMAVTTATAAGGTLIHRTSGTITTLTLGGPTGATLDCSQDVRASKVITNMNLNAGGTIVDPQRVLSLTNGIVVGTDVESVSAA